VNDEATTTESDDLDEDATATTPYAEPVETTTPAAQPAQPQEADATEDSSAPTTEVGHEAANDDGSDAADDWIEVRSKRALRTQRILSGHPTGGAPSTANFPPATRNATEGFYTAKSKSILHHRTNGGLVLTVSDNHHRSVLGAVAPRIKNEHTEVVKCTGVVNKPTMPRGRLTKLKRNNRTRQPMTMSDGHVLV
jgi:hypothetical protein